jgi:hypothetical protein
MCVGDYARWHSANGRPGRDIAGDNCARGDDRPVPDAYRADDDGVRTDRDVVADDHVARVVSSDIGSQASVVLEPAARPNHHVRMDDDTQAVVVQDEVVRQPCLRRQDGPEDHLYPEGEQLGWAVEPDGPDRMREVMEPKNHPRVMPRRAVDNNAPLKVAGSRRPP